MDERQFELLMEKLDMIRCCIIDVEEAIEKSSQKSNAAQDNDQPRTLTPPEWLKDKKERLDNL